MARKEISNFTDGFLIGNTAAEKVAFHGSTTVAQRSGAAQAAVATTAPTNSSPYGFSTSAQAAAIVTLVNELRAALVEKGIIKGSA
jgi:hypothetical protein